MKKTKAAVKVGITNWGITLARGGSEKAVCALANELKSRSYNVSLYCNTNGHPDMTPVYPLKKDIHIIDLNLQDTQSSILHARQRLLSENLDVLLLFFSGPEVLSYPIILFNSGIPLIYAERSTPAAVRGKHASPSDHTACIAAMDRIVLLSEKFRASYPEYVQPRISIIPNSVVIPPTSARPDQASQSGYVLITVGRQVPLKQFHLLLTAFAGLAPHFPDWRLAHYGEGPLGEHDKELAEKLGIADRVDFMGMSDDICQIYAETHLFCLPSAFEGCSNALLEAQAAGLPCVGFVDAPGVNAFIKHGETGLLASEMNAESLAESLYLLMSRPSLRKSMGERAREEMTQYSPQAIYDQWEQLINDVISLKGRTRLMGKLPETTEDRVEAVLKGLLLRHETAFPCDSQCPES